MISAIFKTFLLAVLVVGQVHFAYAQTASILPPAKTTFFDNSGNPLTSGKVFHYIPSTLTAKTTWQDSAESIANTNPVVLDAAGRALIYGDGVYRQIVKDRNNNTIWDQLTSSTGTGSVGPISTGDGDLVGTIKPWAGMTAPNQYAFTYGQEVSRTTYAALFTAITSSQGAFCNSGSPTIGGLSDTTNFWIGMSVEISCVAAGFSTVISKTASSVTLAVNANVTVNTTAVFFPWGRGNGTTTFNLPDFRGFNIAGNNNMGGVASSTLTTTYFGATNPNSTGAVGGTQNTTLIAGNLPSHTHSSSTLTDPGHFHNERISEPGGAGSYVVNALGSGVVGPSLVNTDTKGTGITISANTGTNATGLSTPFSRIGPTKTSNYIIKITPDANSATASGVTSLGGMTGSIACGTYLICTGNIISVSLPATAIELTVGTTTILNSTTYGVLYNNAGVLGDSKTLPTGMTIPAPIIDGNTTNAITVGPNGLTNPTFQVDSSAASVATGVKISGAAAGGGVGIAAISANANEALALNSKGTGAVVIQGVGTGPILLNAATTLTANSAAALSVGQTGGTNSAFKVDTSAATQATGIQVTGFAAGGGSAIGTISSGTNENLVINSKGTGQLFLNNVATGAINLSRTTAVTSIASSAFTAGPNGATNPTLQVDASTASQATGVKISGAAAGGGAGIAAISSGTNEALAINAKGSGAIAIGNVSTGGVTITPNLTASGTINGATLDNLAWATYTPSATCGTATFTTNSARFKSIGKTVHFNIDLTITAIGTCTVNVIFNLPVTSGSSGGLSGRESGVTAKAVACSFNGVATTAACSLADATNFAVNARIAMSGVYEAQ